MKIYLAGKVGKNDWRHTIVAGLRNAYSLVYDYSDHAGCLCFPILDNAIFGEHHYAGPYFISCDHGCLHGAEQHGLGVTEGAACASLIVPSDSHGNTDPAWKWQVRAACLNAIDRSDIVFAYIDSSDCHGTIAEIGYAYAKQKTIWIAFASNALVDELWFVASLADYHQDIYHSRVPEGTHPAAYQLQRYLSSDLANEARLDAQSLAEADHVRETAPYRLRSLCNQVQQTLCRARNIADGGTAAWRELMYDAVVKPLSEALRQSGGASK